MYLKLSSLTAVTLFSTHYSKDVKLSYLMLFIDVVNRKVLGGPTIKFLPKRYLVIIYLITLTSAIYDHKLAKARALYLITFTKSYLLLILTIEIFEGRDISPVNSLEKFYSAH
ncbi:hypothetical protein BY458DRAFT_544272 [Sporodiniella umbellata]|nr:hypothetical protein BY458DRAFT_544272 [Sporodiniella umbellata]